MARLAVISLRSSRAGASSACGPGCFTARIFTRATRCIPGLSTARAPMASMTADCASCLLVGQLRTWRCECLAVRRLGGTLLDPPASHSRAETKTGAPLSIAGALVPRAFIPTRAARTTCGE